MQTKLKKKTSLCYISIIKQGDSNSEAIICFGTKFKLSVDFIQSLCVITGLGFTLSHCHKLFVELQKHSLWFLLVKK